MAETHIQWSQRVWNPTTGCDRVSPGCGLPRPGSDDEATGQTGGCYALSMAKRLKGMGQAKYQNDGDPKTSGPGFGLTVHEDALDLPLRWRKPSKIFVNSMSDLFHADVPDEFIAKVFAVMAAAPQHTFQVLTKRHGRMRSLLNSDAFAEQMADEMARLWNVEKVAPLRGPLPNVWLGVSCEDQHWADVRIPALLATPATVRWISAEPLLGPLNIWQWIDPSVPDVDCDACGEERFADEIGFGHERDIYDAEGLNVIREEWCGGPGKGVIPRRLNWVVAGGESGAGARLLDEEWIRSLVKQCRAAEVPIFVKQLGSVWARQNGADPKGGKPEFWPSDLRVREFPVTDEASDVSREVASDASPTPSPAKSLYLGEGLNTAGPVSRIREEAIGPAAPREGRC